MAVSEIGSDFFKVEKNNTVFLLSGRTAEDYIIRDILETHTIKNVLMPSLCCHTMIEPFIRNGMSVSFYDVVYEDGLKAVLPEKRNCEVLFYLDYFGYGGTTGLKNAKNWDVTIEDCTHSWLIKDVSEADYSFISYRKWSGFSAVAKAVKRDGKFNTNIPNKWHGKYETLREDAMQLKEEFIERNIGNKEDYLEKFDQAEELLESDYLDYTPSYASLINLLEQDTEMIKKQRRKNAKVLLDGIRGIDGIKPLFPILGELSVPLNVPVLILDGQRDRLRKYMIENEIYCPVHWSLSDMHEISEAAKKIYDEILSLICDQRYGTDDMEREVEVIRDFYRKM